MKKNVLSLLCLLMVLALSASGFAEEAVSIKDDFYEAVNAQWLAEAEIPSDRPYLDSFIELSQEIDELLMADFDAMLRGEKQPEDELVESFIEFYRLTADFDTRNADGAKPLLPYMQMVESLGSLADFADGWAAWDILNMPAPFTVMVTADMGNAAMNALYIQAPVLMLGDKSYYLDADTKAMLQAAMGQMLTNLLVMTGKDEAEAQRITQEALAFDESLVPYIRSAAEASDYTTIYNPMDFAAFDAQVSAIDFTAAFTSLLGQTPETIIVADPAYFEAFDLLVNEETYPQLKSWLLVQTMCSFASYLSNDFRLESGSYSRMLSGTAEATSMEKSAYYLAYNMFSEVVGLHYGRTYFGEQAKQDVQQMVAQLVDIYEQRLAENDWLSAETREMAIRKLNTMAINIGYPDAPHPLYTQMKTVPASEGGTLLGNAMAFTQLSKTYSYSQWNQPVDRSQWVMSADTVNAGYSPMNNSINFPAGILQAPFYSLDQSPSANYGGIGAVIAHEISHAFDPNGAKFDEYGSLADWWTQEDYTKFSALSQAMIDQFDGIEFAGGTVNGAQVVAENVADVGGLACALEASKQEDADITELFTSWARIWRVKITPEFASMLLVMDVHSPHKLRANIHVQNFEEFFEAFDIQEGDAMYRAPEDRVIIW